MTAGPTGAEQPSTVTAGTAGRTGPTGPTSPAITDQPRSATGTTGHPGSRRRKTVAAVPEQQPAGRAVRIPRRPVSAVANQRTPQQRLTGRINRPQHVLSQRLQRRGISPLSPGIRAPGTGQHLHKLLMKHRRTSTKHLISLPMLRKQRRHSRRHLIGTRGHHPRRRSHHRRIRSAQRRADTRQIGRRHRQHLWGRHHKRHNVLPATQLSPLTTEAIRRTNRIATPPITPRFPPHPTHHHHGAAQQTANGRFEQTQ
ncbi:hypothetical protein LAUMK7_05514 [Mycobacterium kansasii]|nr:hypothetical protein LAUMK22_04886 [Mycobacterium kansasii]VAZ69477.1 hypothetical protein LAUMK40_05638 [Mycobacterium kansasii]VAZ80760.1 hypothetical protein LAUMK7_05514 [Mycobacterium kansasii]